MRSFFTPFVLSYLLSRLQSLFCIIYAVFAILYSICCIQYAQLGSQMDLEAELLGESKAARVAIYFAFETPELIHLYEQLLYTGEGDAASSSIWRGTSCTLTLASLIVLPASHRS